MKDISKGSDMAEMDDYGRHEVLHMASFLSRAVASELCEHAQVQANPEWKALAESAAKFFWGALPSHWRSASPTVGRSLDFGERLRAVLDIIGVSGQDFTVHVSIRWRLAHNNVVAD